MINLINKQSYPPGPSGRWRTTLKLIRDPRKTLQEWADEYGDPFHFHALNGHVVVTGRPDLIQQIFSHDPMMYEPFAKEALEPILGSGSMLMLSGNQHRRERKLVMPMFHGDRMRAYANIMQNSAVDSMNAQSTGISFNMLDVTTDISLKVIVAAIFGSENPESSNRLLQLAQQSVKASSPLLFFSPKLHIRFLGLTPWDRFLRAQSNLRSAFDDELARRENEPAQRHDILTMLTEAKYEDGSSIDPDHAFDELATFLFAGHETSAIAMAWAIYHLLRNPDSLAELKEEIKQAPNDSPEQLARLPLLKAVVQETLRLHPVVTEVLRFIKEPMELDGHLLPAGTAVAPAIVLAHYHEETFADPDEFRPQRFLNRTYSSAEYFPFGGGHRRCAGAAFALYEMSIVLGTIVSRYSLELLETSPVVPRRRNITMGPSTGIRVRLC